MSRRALGILMLLVGSEAFALLSGHWYFGIFNKTVPTAVMTDFNRSAAYGLFLFRGMLLGLVLFLWSFLVVLAAPYFRKSTDSMAPGAARS